MLFVMNLSSSAFQSFFAISYSVKAYFSSFARQSRMELQARRFTLSHSISSSSSGLSPRVKCRFIWTSISLTSHLHMPKLLLPSNFSTSNLAWDTGVQCLKVLVLAELLTDSVDLDSAIF
ncbi:hypothetical protein CsSME_00036383 [Camellia sinensis var. sinensis]